MKDLTFLHGLLKEEITEGNSFFDDLRCPHDEVHREVGPDAATYLCGFPVALPLEGHEHEKVHVGVFPGVAARVGAEQVQALEPLAVQLLQPLLELLQYRFNFHAVASPWPPTNR